MEKKLDISVDVEIYERFMQALELTNVSEKDALESAMRWYITKSQKKSANCNNSGDFCGKANNKIPLWADKPTQYNHKIIKAYYKSIDIAGKATLSMMEHLCSQDNDLELFVPTFRANYAQMKADGPKTHGKVFEDDGENVWIWSEVKETMLKYKNFFYRSDKL